MHIQDKENCNLIYGLLEENTIDIKLYCPVHPISNAESFRGIQENNLRELKRKLLGKD